jgi:hypothetical protein
MSQSQRGSHFCNAEQCSVTVHNPLHSVVIVHEAVQCDVTVSNALHSVVTVGNAVHCTATFGSAVQVVVMVVSCTALLHLVVPCIACYIW